MRNLRGSYRASELGHIYAIEHMMSPELALALIAYLEHDDPTRNDDDQKQVPFPRDLRDLQLWNLAVIAYELLHGYSPWEDPEMIVFDINYHPAGMDDMDVDIHKDIRSERRERIINEPIPISDELGLSQDCVDYLTAAFHKDPEQRPKVEDLAAFPWFSGAYLDSGADFTRPPRLTDE